MKIIIIFLFILSLLKKGHGEKFDSLKNSLLSSTKTNINIDVIRNLTYFHHSLEETLQIKNEKESIILHEFFYYAINLNKDLMTHPIFEFKNTTNCKIQTYDLLVDAIVEVFDKITRCSSNNTATFENMCHQYLWSLDLQSQYPKCYVLERVEILQCLDDNIKNKNVDKLYNDLISNYYNSYKSVNLSLDNCYYNVRVALNNTIKKIINDFDLCILSLPITLKKIDSTDDSKDETNHSNYGKNLTNLYHNQQDIINTNNFRMFDQIKTIDWRISMNYLNYTFVKDKNVTCCLNYSEEYFHRITTNTLIESDKFFNNQTKIFTNFINAIIQRDDVLSTFNFCLIYKKNSIADIVFGCIDRYIVKNPTNKMIKLYQEFDNSMKRNRDLMLSTFNDFSQKTMNTLENGIKRARISFDSCLNYKKEIKNLCN